ncbi:MAG: Asp-tRNA(Asn)/Glu-tRNA(Gln) amidotransferase GatCAB subunit B [Proteobacteria bacterium]|nr:Asp-tRNA(Asn)/Glu-tRNA(Gln) amidotransferase GatCAB subunit B [Pseudomonadota bacterium]NCA28719.1 Asp-tRNA(Asn)/Glu-tRNA(Gln) amidotransferase GatCAB subunit B [Pseudomonadota bacterium]
MTYTIQGKTHVFEIVVGCEIHAQIASNSKLFSRSSTTFGSEPNSQVSLVDCALPGMLPTINEKCVEQAIKTGLGINAKINLVSIFDRKNYFYPDLPQGYQISQFSDPIVGEGKVEITLENGHKKTIRIERIHLEQDAGKSVHDQHPQFSLIDLNRSGIALMEIVSKPDMNSPFEASEYVKTIRSIVRSLETCDGDMEKGNLRCDANVSVRKVGDPKLGTRCEIKNLNSMRNIARAIEYEAKRQVDIIENGGAVEQETRLFDALNGETRTMRSKEDAMDYRYFPDPDLPRLVLSQEFVDDIKKTLPELPQAKKERYIRELKISEYDAGVLTADEQIANYFEQLITKHEAKLSTTWLTVELFGRMNKLSIKFEDLKVSASNLCGLLDLIVSGEISGKIAKDVLDIMIETGENAQKIVEDKGLKQVSDSGALEKIIDEVIKNNQENFEKLKAGDQKLLGFFVGQIMKASNGQANPKLVNEILRKKI